MAAYAALVTLSKAVHQILPYEQHYSFLCHKHQMQSLHEKVISFQVFLEHISQKSHSSDDIDELDSRIRDVACRLEDIIEPILVHSLALEYQNEVNSRLSVREANAQVPSTPEGSAVRRKPFFRGLVDKCVPYCWCTVKDGTDNQISAESETETSLNDILERDLDQDLENKAKYSHLSVTECVATAFGDCIEEADLLLEEAMDMKNILENKAQVVAGTSIYSHNATTSLSRGPPDANDTMVGLKDDLIQILDRITRTESALEVIPITGMGGIGKTTLARAVYDHHGKQRHFDLVLWATVSQQFNIVKEILRVLCPENVVSEEILSVHQRLKGRRYLIILDDVWDEKVWDNVRIAFPDDNNYSRVILTTRLSKVATYVCSSGTHAHQMQLLNEEHSWDLLRETVYGHGADCPGEFEDMGRMISRSCKGLPLALVVIGGLLKFNKAKDYWLKVAESTTAEAAAYDESILKILSLSYTNLPPYLKACLLYFGSFPEDKGIPTKELVRLWCAEGFLKPRESKTMEVVAEECLEELVERNLILVKEKRYDGKIKTSSIHDLLRDLSLRQAQKEKFLYRHDGSSEMDNNTSLRIIKDQRRVSFPEFNLDCNVSFNSHVRTFRTEDEMYPRQLSTIIPHFKLLRVLGKVKWSSSSSVRISFRLNNLRYLHLNALNGYSRLTVPKSISKLRNLETLIVSRVSSTAKYQLFLPVQIWEMPRLRHLVSEVSTLLPPFPTLGLGVYRIESSSLRSLTGLVNFDVTATIIQKLQNLKKLEITYQEISSDNFYQEFRLDNLVNLHQLEDLTVSSDILGPRLTNIGFPRNLKKLSLKETRLPWEMMAWIGDSLKHLEVLKLEVLSFKGDIWEPIEGGFLQLKYLKMEWLPELEEWRAESRHFPSLEKLVILDCPRLKEVPAEIGEIDTLQKLIVKNCYYFFKESVRASFEESVQRIREEQQSVGNDSLQIIFLSNDQYLRDVDR